MKFPKKEKKFVLKLNHKRFKYGLKFDNNLVERLHGTIRDRNKTQRELEKEDSMFIQGHQLYYNFVKPHQSLESKTPSDETGIFIEGDNKWLVLLKKAVEYQKAKINSID